MFKHDTTWFTVYTVLCPHIGYGAGANVYVIDTGINPTHVDFGGRAAIAGDFLGGDVR